MSAKDTEKTTVEGSSPTNLVAILANDSYRRKQEIPGLNEEDFKKGTVIYIPGDNIVLGPLSPEDQLKVKEQLDALNKEGPVVITLNSAGVITFKENSLPSQIDVILTAKRINFESNSINPNSNLVVVANELTSQADSIQTPEGNPKGSLSLHVQKDAEKIDLGKELLSKGYKLLVPSDSMSNYEKFTIELIEPFIRKQLEEKNEQLKNLENSKQNTPENSAKELVASIVRGENNFFQIFENITKITPENIENKTNLVIASIPLVIQEINNNGGFGIGFYEVFSTRRLNRLIKEIESSELPKEKIELVYEIVKKFNQQAAAAQKPDGKLDPDAFQNACREAASELKKVAGNPTLFEVFLSYFFFYFFIPFSMYMKGQQEPVNTDKFSKTMEKVIEDYSKILASSRTPAPAKPEEAAKTPTPSPAPAKPGGEAPKPDAQKPPERESDNEVQKQVTNPSADKPQTSNGSNATTPPANQNAPKK